MLFNENDKQSRVRVVNNRVPETPLRDHIQLNVAGPQSNEWEPKSLKQDIKSLLASLPEP